MAVIRYNNTSNVQDRLNEFLPLLSPSNISAWTLTAVDVNPGSTGAFIMPSNWDTATGGTAITVTVRFPFHSGQLASLPVLPQDC